LELIYYYFAVFGAVGSFIGGITNLMAYWQNRRTMEMKGHQSTKTALFTGTALTIIFLLVVSGILLAREEYKNEQLTTEAWKAYNDGKYTSAIDKAKECILEFQGEALRQEEALRDAKAEQPPIGKTTEEIAGEIFKRGILNDVGTCWVVIGMSELKLNHEEKAISAFEKARQFTYARTYDPSWEGFWSPSEKAADYIKSLQGDLY
jgi:hypothetical protein